MKHLSCIGILLASCVSFPATAAESLNNVSWVASYGSVGNPCTRELPCSGFERAISYTLAGGVVNCIDNGSYGQLNADRSITVDCTGTHASTVLVSPNAAGITVIARGLAIEGGLGSGVGIHILVPATVEIEDCTIGGVAYSGGNTGNAVYLKPFGSGTAKLTLKNVKIAGIGNNGILVDSTATSSPIYVSVRDSLISSSGGSGILAITSSSAEIRLMVVNTEISKNGLGVNSNGARSNVIIGRSTITENQIGLATGGGGRIFSYGTNEINGNNNDNVNVSTLISQN